jgi:hypothetical protein
VRATGNFIGTINGKGVLPLTRFDEILTRSKDVAGVGSEKDLAEVLGLQRQAVGSARQRGEAPAIWLVKIAVQFKVSLDINRQIRPTARWSTSRNNFTGLCT